MSERSQAIEILLDQARKSCRPKVRLCLQELEVAKEFLELDPPRPHVAIEKIEFVISQLKEL